MALVSIAGLMTEDGLAAYSASESALISLVRRINIEEAERALSLDPLPVRQPRRGIVMTAHDSFFVGSSWRKPRGSTRLEVISPSTEEVVGSVPQATTDDIDTAVESARRSFDTGPWSRMSVRERGDYLIAIGAWIQNRMDDAVRVQIDEMGAARSFIEPGTRGFLSMIPSQIDLVDSLATREVRRTASGNVVVYHEPVGVVGSIIPWNAPIPTMVARMLPALLTGCTLIVKPPPESPLSAYLVGEAAEAVGLPAGVLSLIPGGREVGEHLVTHAGVDKVSFTGSSAAGSRVASLCGAGMKRMTLELGGKSAAIVLDDVDLDAHLGTLVGSSLPNSGQVCYATTRILVPRSRASEIVERLVAEVAELTVGDPHDPATRVGPVVAARQRDTIERYITMGVESGATLALGGHRPVGLPRGWYVEPTVFTKVDNRSVIAQEEIFGPVLCVIEYDADEDAVAIANDSKYGLGGAVFTSDPLRGLRIAEQVRTGTFVLNDGVPGGGGGPFGGMKLSGMGRERGHEGYSSYYEVKSVALPRGVEI